MTTSQGSRGALRWAVRIVGALVLAGGAVLVGNAIRGGQPATIGARQTSAAVTTTTVSPSSTTTAPPSTTTTPSTYLSSGTLPAAVVATTMRQGCAEVEGLIGATLGTPAQFSEWWTAPKTTVIDRIALPEPGNTLGMAATAVVRDAQNYLGLTMYGGGTVALSTVSTAATTLAKACNEAGLPTT